MSKRVAVIVVSLLGILSSCMYLRTGKRGGRVWWHGYRVSISHHLSYECGYIALHCAGCLTLSVKWDVMIVETS